MKIQTFRTHIIWLQEISFSFILDQNLVYNFNSLNISGTKRNNFNSKSIFSINLLRSHHSVIFSQGILELLFNPFGIFLYLRTDNENNQFQGFFISRTLYLLKFVFHIHVLYHE